MFRTLCAKLGDRPKYRGQSKPGGRDPVGRDGQVALLERLRVAYGNSMRRDRLLLMRVVLVLILMALFIISRNVYSQATQPQGIPSGGVPQSLQEKMRQLQALVEKRQQEGADLQPIGDLMQGLQPLIQEQKFGEAEALVDRALNLAAGLKPSPGRTAPEQSSLPLRPQALHLENQIWGRLRAAIVDPERGGGVKARCYLTDSADQPWSPSGAITYVKPLERHFIASGEFEIALPPGTYILRVERGTEYRPVIRRIEIRATEIQDEKIELARWVN